MGNGQRGVAVDLTPAFIADYEQLQRDFDRLRASGAAACEAEAERLRSQVQDLSGQRDRLQGQLQQVEGELQEARRQRQESDAQVQRLDLEKSQLTAQLAAARARSFPQQWASLLKQPLELSNSLDTRFVLLPAGQFWMGAPDTDLQAERDERQRHQVRITKPVWLAKYAVTQAEYQRVMGLNPSAYQQSGATAPVDSVSWNEAVEFCRKLSASSAEQAAGRAYRLPTEAEWEYACRAGTETRYSFGDAVGELGDYAWHSGNSDWITHPVGLKKPNAWGLCDMHGNVWEWCGDWYEAAYYNSSPADDPRGPAGGSFRVARGGSWSGGASRCRSSCRNWVAPDHRGDGLGFRLAMELTS